MNSQLLNAPPPTLPGTPTGSTPPVVPPTIGALGVSSSINSTFKIEAKEYPKLPKKTNLKGKEYNDWHDVFTVKMKQAGCGALLEDAFVMPVATDANYLDIKMKDDYINNILTSCTLRTNAYD